MATNLLWGRRVPGWASERLELLKQRRVNSSTYLAIFLTSGALGLHASRFSPDICTYLLVPLRWSEGALFKDWMCLSANTRSVLPEIKSRVPRVTTNAPRSLRVSTLTLLQHLTTARLDTLRSRLGLYDILLRLTRITLGLPLPIECCSQWLVAYE